MKTTGYRTGKPGGFFLRFVFGTVLLILAAAFCIFAAADSTKPHATREPLVTQEPAPLPDMPDHQCREQNAEAGAGKINHHIAEFPAAALHKFLMILVRAGIEKCEQGGQQNK